MKVSMGETHLYLVIKDANGNVASESKLGSFEIITSEAGSDDSSVKALGPDLNCLDPVVTKPNFQIVTPERNVIKDVEPDLEYASSKALEIFNS